MMADFIAMSWIASLRRVLLLTGAILLTSLSSLSVDGQSARTPKAKPLAAASQASKEEIQEARQRLAELGYWLDPKAEGIEASLRHALIAFQKIEGRPRTGLLTTEELQALRLAKRPAPQETGYSHIEVDLYRQVLFVVEVGEVDLRILPVSSGSGKLFTEGGVTRRAITPLGRFAVQRKIMGWRKSPLGLLYYPSYIHGGVAIHGNPAVPAQPASHGCIRIPMFAAQEFSELAAVGMVVLVYDSSDSPMLPLQE